MAKLVDKTYGQALFELSVEADSWMNTADRPVLF